MLTNRYLLKLTLCVLTLGFVGGLAGAAVWLAWQQPYTAASAYAPTLTANTRYAANFSLPPADAPASFADAAAAATDAVVFIQTLTEGRKGADDFWSLMDFFGNRGPVQGAGSGVVLGTTDDGKGGYIITNFHVVQGADQITVSLRNKHSYPATLVGTDPNTDLALLRIEATGLKPLPLANSDQLRIGDWVLAIGNPFNLQYTVTAGIVSAKGRNINILNTQFPIESFIQTDAAINPGNSGGALVNVAGQLVGVNAAIASRTGTYNGYGFAIPANIVRKVARDLQEFGQVQRAFIGAEVVDIDNKVGKNLTPASGSDFAGVLVSRMEADGPAAKAGLETGDIVLRINDAAIDTKAEFLEHLSYYRPGDEVALLVRRDGKQQARTVKLVNEDGAVGMVKRITYTDNELGADITALSKAELSKFGVTSGFRLTNLRGRIANLGLPDGFVILKVNNYVPETPQEVGKLLLNSRGRISVQGIQPNGQPIAFNIINY